MNQPHLTLVTATFNQVTPNPWNPHGCTAEEMDELIESIATKGVLDTPTVVEWDRDVACGAVTLTPSTPYLLVDGQQRFTATREAFMRGLRDTPAMPFTCIGRASAFSDAALAELGEALNHRGRGSIEDVTKTGIIASWLAAKKGPAEAARLMGKKPAFVAAALASVTQLSPLPTSSQARPQAHQQRKSLNIVLPFDDELAVEEFELLLQRVDTPDDVPTKGQRRAAAVMEALRAYDRALLGE